MVQDFKLIRWLDLVTFGGACFFSTLCLICFIINKVSGDALNIMLITTICFYGVYGVFLYARQKFLNKITFITKHQIAVIANTFKVDQTEFEAETDEMITKWNAACNFDKSAGALVGLWVEFQQFPLTLSGNNEELAGYLKGNNAVVGWKPDLKTTALQHEMGHAIHAVYYGSLNNDVAHKFMTDNKLP